MVYAVRKIGKGFKTREFKTKTQATKMAKSYFPGIGYRIWKVKKKR